MGSVIFRAPAGEVPVPPFRVSQMSLAVVRWRWSCLPAPLGTPNPGILPGLGQNQLPPSLAPAMAQKAPSVPLPNPGPDPAHPNRHSRHGAAAPAWHPNSQAGHELSIPISTAGPGVWGAPCCPRLALLCRHRDAQPGLLSCYRGPGPETTRAGRAQPRPSGSSPGLQTTPLPQSSRAERPGSAWDYPQRNIPREQDCSLGPNGKEERDGIKGKIMTISLARPGK